VRWTMQTPPPFFAVSAWAAPRLATPLLPDFRTVVWRECEDFRRRHEFLRVQAGFNSSICFPLVSRGENCLGAVALKAAAINVDRAYLGTIKNVHERNRGRSKAIRSQDKMEPGLHICWRKGRVDFAHRLKQRNNFKKDF
jgi:hypothetical protein